MTRPSLVLLFSPRAPRAQEKPPGGEPPPVFTTQVEMVVVDVIVSAGEGPVAGLRREDFAVTEDGVPQEIMTFDAVDVAGGHREGARGSGALLARHVTRLADRRRSRQLSPRFRLFE
jgi:hypothetical protein